MSKLRLLLEGRSGDTANRWSVELYSFLVQDSAASQCPPAINIPTRWLPKWKNLFRDFLKKTPNRVSALHFSGSVNFKSWKALGILVKVHFISSQKNFSGPLLRTVVIRHTHSLAVTLEAGLWDGIRNELLGCGTVVFCRAGCQLLHRDAPPGCVPESGIPRLSKSVPLTLPHWPCFLPTPKESQRTEGY